MDDSGFAIALTLWGTICEKVTAENIHTAIAVKGAKVSEYGGRSLNAAEDHAQLFTELNHPRIVAL